MSDAIAYLDYFQKHLNVAPGLSEKDRAFFNVTINRLRRDVRHVLTERPQRWMCETERQARAQNGVDGALIAAE